MNPLLRILPIILFLLLPAACGDEPVALAVGSTTFTEEQLLGLSDARLEELALITVVAEARVRDEEDGLGAPARQRGRIEARVQGLREEVILEAAGVSEEDLEARYQEDPEVELEVRHLVTLSERWRPDAHRAQARERAAAALERIREGASFPEIAGEVSDEPGAARRGGLLEPGREGTWVPEFWEAANQLEVGEVSEVVESEFGFHVLRLEARDTLPFEAGRARIVRTMAEELGGVTAWESWRTERLDELALHEDAIAGLALPVPSLQSPDPAPMDDSRLAEWPGGSLTAAEFASYLQGGTRASWREFAEGSPEIRLERVRAAAFELYLDQLAEERGLEASEGDLAALDREWEQRLVSWTAFLGLPEELSAEESAEHALEALRTNDQNARIARSELREWSPALFAAYEVRAGSADGS